MRLRRGLTQQNRALGQSILEDKGHWAIAVVTIQASTFSRSIFKCLKQTPAHKIKGGALHS